ncbi:hypothetical protein LTR62_000238 [Meristemomyces frigidus]|uniref:Uncharacterized protein n=1 Tax=Meristemomyces frigidus TaxID=1508187 RepID=A0AAN7TQH7_9PEZI|nr:hypothetical protein LTR62_000238 [Meristemomyces frigidus]
MSVNVPTNPQLKEKDINSKLQLFGIYEAFANGKVPSNKQIDVAMNSALEWNELRSPSKKLSTEGQQLVGDLRRVIEESKILLLSKNEGNLLQDFIWQTQNIGAGNASTPNAPINRDTAKQHGNQALQGLRTLGELLITNGQFRKLLSDATVLLRDIAGDAAQKAANKVNPGEEELNKLDEPAPDNTWHEKPDLSTGNLRQQVQQKLPIGKKDLQDAAGDASQTAHPSGERDPRAVGDRAMADQQNAGAGNTSVDAQGGLKAGAQNLKDKISNNTDEDSKQRAREYRERTNNYFKEKLPKDRREQIIYRLKKMVVEIQGHSDYQQAIDTLLRLAEEYTGHSKTMAGQSKEAVKGAHDQDSLTSAEADLKTLLERFANSTSFDDLFDSVNQMYSDADRDPELKDWFKSMDRFVRRCLQEQGYILQDDSNEHWNRLYDHGNYLLRDRYRNHTDRIVDELKFLADQFDKDPQNQRFAQAMNTLFQNLGNDENGQPTFKPHLIKDLTEVIIPGFFQVVRYVPVPRIEYSDPMVDMIIENLVLEGDNLAPNMFEFGSDNYWRWGRKGFQSKNKNKVMLSVAGIQMDLRDVSYYVKKKEGFPGITDKGVMDIFLGGTGLSFKVAMETADKTDKHHFFKINTVTVDIKNINIKLKQSNHKLLFNLFKPLLLKVMRPALQKIAETQIRNQVQQLDGMLFKIKQEADRAQEEAKNNPDPEHLQNMYQRYFTAFQQQMTKGQQKADKTKEAAADKKVNVALTKDDSMFKNINLPGGISTKATEYKHLAEKGDRWESPVFSLGSAKESSSLPGVSKVQRKRHDVTSGGVRGTRGLESTGANLSGQVDGQRDVGNTGYGNTGYGTNASNYGSNSGMTSGLAGGRETGALGSNNGGFANQVDGAFAGSNTGLAGANTGLTGGSSGLTGANSGLTGTSAPLVDESGHTLLGKNNPVLQGRV